MAPRSKRTWKQAASADRIKESSTSNNRTSKRKRTGRAPRRVKNSKASSTTSLESETPSVESSSQVSDTSPTDSVTSARSSRKSLTPKRALVRQNEPTFRFNLAMELWPEYSLIMVQDRSFAERDWTSSRLKSEVMYLESGKERFELTRILTDQTKKSIAKPTLARYRLCKVNSPCTWDSEAMRSSMIPLAPEHKQEIFTNLDWREIRWGQNKVQFREKVFELSCVAYFPFHKPGNKVCTVQKKIPRPAAVLST